MMTERLSTWKRIDQTGWPLLILRLIVGAFFVYTGLKKVGDPVSFLKLIHMYPMLQSAPPLLLNSTAVILPWTEVACGLALILGLFIRGASSVITIMLVVFTPMIFWRAWGEHLTTGKPFMDIAFDCGCGTGVRIIWHKLIENGVFLLLAFVIFLSGTRRYTLERWLDARRTNRLYCRLCGYVLRAESASCSCSHAAV
jgi:uncharacterized membrane protein YphA (DoxX/SURF4 family)